MMPIDETHTALYNQCDYTNSKSIKMILKNFNTFKAAAAQGNYTALVILMDIQNALQHLENRRQQYCITQCLVYGYTQAEIARKLNICHSTVSLHVRKGISSIIKYLNDDVE